MTTISKSKTSDIISGILNLSLLHLEIELKIPKFIFVSSEDNDNMDIIFSSTLDTDENNLLTDILENHPSYPGQQELLNSVTESTGTFQISPVYYENLHDQSQSISTSSKTIIQLNSVPEFNQSGFITNTTDHYISVPKPGIYYFIINCSINSSNTQFFTLSLERDDGTSGSSYSSVPGCSSKLATVDVESSLSDIEYSSASASALLNISDKNERFRYVIQSNTSGTYELINNETNIKMFYFQNFENFRINSRSLLYTWKYDNISGKDIDNEYEILFYTDYLGYNFVVPQSVSLIYKLKNYNYSGSFRIFDRTNNNIICSFDLDKADEDSDEIVKKHTYNGSFDNLSVNEAIWEIQIKSESKSKKLYLLNMNIYS